MAAKTKYNCPNCGSTLYSGLADGDILVCRDNEDPPNGCQAAWDPKELDSEVVVEEPVEAAPEIGPAGEAEIHAGPPAVTPDPDPVG